MASQSTSRLLPSIVRHRPVLFALTAVALSCTIYYIREQFRSTLNPPKGTLRRSNARRQRPRRYSFSHHVPDYVAENSRYAATEPWGTVPVSLDFLTDITANSETYGQHLFFPRTGPGFLIPLQRSRIPRLEDISGVLTDPGEARELRRELEEGFLIFYFWRHLPPSTISEEQRAIISSALQHDGGFSADQIAKVLQEHQDNRLTGSVEQWMAVQEQRSITGGEVVSLSSQTAATGPAFSSRLAPTASPPDSEADRETEDGLGAGKDGQSLLNLLYRIAEEQARKDGYVHRRVACDSCNVTPIRGIRYRCANCHDYDLCEQCEALQIHTKTHLFYKIRVPAPYLGTSRQPEPVWYPGKPNSIVENLSKDTLTRISKDTGYQVPEVEALWEQFRCLAATEYPEDPSQYYKAIDRRTFNKCFVPNTSIRPSPPNLIYDRIFSFYDQNNDGLIGFEEFIKGLSNLTRKNLDDWLKRIFQGHDYNNDGYVDRKDFLRMFRAYYAANKELTRDIVAGMNDDNSDNTARDLVLGSQPISSTFFGPVPRGEHSRAGVAKVIDSYGDYKIDDKRGAIENRDHDVAEPDEILADAAEQARFDNVHARSTDLCTDCSAIYNDPWPPKLVSRRDVQKLLATHSSYDVEDVAATMNQITDPIEQQLIRRYAHERIATEHQERQFIRRQAIRNRRRRQSFYSEGVSSDYHMDRSDPRQGGMGTVSDEDITRWWNFRRIARSDQDEKMRAALVDCVNEIEWPVESATEFVDKIVRLFQLGWTGKAIADDFSGYGSGLADSADFVDMVFEQLGRAVKQFIPEADTVELPEPLPSIRRSRSSSKVRFQHDLETDDEHDSRSMTSMSSRSVPINERWGSFEVPGPEKDVGREVLYQVTHEAFNELLDPVFRLREDLALAVQRTVIERKRYRSQIISAVKDVISVSNYLDMYQRRWRRRTNGSSYNYAANLETDEATLYLESLVDKAAGSTSLLTAEMCPKCTEKNIESLILLGRYCASPGCGFISSGLRGNSTSKKFCSRCAEWGKESPMNDISYWLSCIECGTGSRPSWEEKARLSRIIHGSPPSSATEEAQHQDQPHVVISGDALGPNVLNHQESEHKVITDSNKPAINPATPAPHDPSSPYSEVIQDLSLSLAAFNATDSRSLEQGIIQRPLENLLESAGYIAVDLPQDTSGTPDPTLPQHRLNSIPHLDPTLPHHRPNADSEENPETHQHHTAGSRINDLDSDSDVDSNLASPPAAAGKHKSLRDPDVDADSTADPGPSAAVLHWYASLNLIEYQDKLRGGPGRLSLKEFEELMIGEKGSNLGFLACWMEMANF